jgi:hypothetical protein
MRPEVELSIVLPCYNEMPVLHDSVARIADMLSLSKWPAEIIFVDDGSTDGTRAELEAYREQAHGVPSRVILHEVNTGRGGAVTTGIRASRGRIVGFLDIDLEVDACYILPLALEIERGADVAYGFRHYNVRPGGWVRWACSKGYMRLVSRMLGTPRMDTESGYKLFNRSRILPLLDEVQNRGWFWDTEIMVRAYLAGMTIVHRPVLFRRRRDKRSTLRLGRDIRDYLRQLRAFRDQVSKARRAATGAPEPVRADAPGGGR